MSDMDYEKAWKKLKDFTSKLAGTSLRFAEQETKDEIETYFVIGGALFSDQIFLKMERIEKEMTIAGQDDDQQAQD